MLKKIRKAIRILVFRLRTQGLWVTLQWAVGRGIPKLTGVPLEMNSAITPTIYVGPQYNARGKRWLENKGINAVINMRTEYDDAKHGLDLQHYLHLPTIDDDAPTIKHLQAGVLFIQQILDEGGKVYIHCMGGIGRAPTMAAAYFISTGMTTDEAIAFIKRKRPFINITPPQLERLRDFEKLTQQEPIH